jgi:hypothetical protein
MNISGLSGFAAATPTTLALRKPLRTETPEALLGLESPRGQSTQQSATSSSSVAPESADKPVFDASGQPALSAQEQRLLQQEILALSNRDREVRAHEQAHTAVGGSYAGAPTYTFQRGPDGRSYAIGGEVSIDAGISSDPAATIRKMEQVQRAALAPAEPSAQDFSVAARAQVLAAQARSELAQQQLQEAADATAERKAQAAERTQAEQDKTAEKPQDSSSLEQTAQQDSNLAPNLQVYARLSGLQEPLEVLDVRA